MATTVCPSLRRRPRAVTRRCCWHASTRAWSPRSTTICSASGLGGKYSQFVIAGASVAVVAPKFAAWRPAFWDNLGATIELHRIRKVITIDHRDCGAARIAYGAAALATPERETETHKKALAQFRSEINKRHPKLAAVTGLMALDGSLQIFS